MSDSEELGSSPSKTSVVSSKARSPSEGQTRSRSGSASRGQSRNHSRSTSRSSSGTDSGDTTRSSSTRSGSLRIMDLQNLPCSVQYNLSCGAKFNCCMSTIRKYLCLFIFLDLAAHSIIYIQYLQHADDYTLMDLVECQMKCYEIQTSFVDILLLSICRFFILELAYGVLRLNTWVGSGLTTALTSVFIIVKPLHYNWEMECQRLWPVTMMILSFTFAWLEAFLVDFRMIGMEELAEKYADARPVTFRKELPRISLFRAFFPLTWGLLRSVVIRSDSMTLFHPRIENYD